MLLPIDRIYTCKSLDQAIEYLCGEESAIPLAAGTDIVPMLRDGFLSGSRLVDIHGIKELDYILYEEGLLRIGSMTTHQTIAKNEIIQKYIPALACACAQVGSAQIRRRATIGGNICHASPAADSLPVLIAAGACAVIQSKDYKKTVLLENFITGPKKTELSQGSLLKEITILIPEGGWKGNFYKIGGRSALTISIASAAVLRGEKGYRAAYGSMSACVKRINLVEDYLNSISSVEKKGLRSVVGTCLTPITDIRASKEYRLEAASNLTWLGWYELQDNN